MKAKTVLALLVLGSMSAGETVTTVRVGEQDTCRITGVTRIAPAKKGSVGDVIRFDLGRLPKGVRIRRALLRMWATPGGRRSAFAIGRWNDKAFAGLKVWAVGGGDEPLAVSYPFAYTPVACNEWDVTAAAAGWAAAPASNKGLKTNFPLPAADSQPAWRRPYLQVTYVGPNPNRPKQPTNLKARYRCGQVFLTWKQIAYDGAFFDSTYRVYVHTAPITAGNLDQAALVGEVHRNSQLNYRRTAYSHDGMGSYAGYGHFKGHLGVKKTKEMTNKMYWDAMGAKIPPRYNFVIDDTWPAKIEGGKWLADAKVLGHGLRELKGPELPDDTGLFVHTVGRAGKLHFAVTSVIEGNENREDFAPGNALAAPIPAKVEPTKPILQVAFHRMDKGYPHQKLLMLEYAYWAGGGDGLAIEPSTPFYFRMVPPGEFVGLRRPGSGPPWITVEPWWSHGGAPVVVDSVYMPPTRLSPFPPNRVPFTTRGWQQAGRFYRGWRKPPGDGAGFGRRDRIPNFYGYHDAMNTGRDPRKATVVPYFENRALRELEHYFRAFPKASREHVRATGEGKAMLMAIHHPDVFAHCSAAQEEIWTSKRQQHQWAMIGRPEWKLKNDRGENAWDWNDPVWYAKKYPTLAWPFISHTMSPNYARGDQTHWGDSGYPKVYFDLVADKRGGQWWWCDIGDAPNGGYKPLARNEAYLAFTNCNFCETPRQEWRREPRGTLNGYLDWHTERMPFKAPRVKRGQKPPPEPKLPLETVDQPERFEVAIRIGDRGRSLNGQSVPPTTARYGQTDITLWRLQQFKVAKGRKYLWTNRKTASGSLLQGGVIGPDERGLLTVPGFFVDRDPFGNKLTITPARGAPPKPNAVKVGALSFAEYVKACRNPVLFPPVKAPSTKFTLGQFTYVGRCNPDGSVSFKGGSFGGVWDTIVQVAEPGPYVIAVRAKGAYGAAWPLMRLGLGGKYGRAMATKFVDTTAYAPQRWYARLSAGKLRVRLNAFGDYYARGVMPALAEKRLHIADLTFTRVDEAKAAKTAVEIRVMPRRVTVPAGMGARFTAVVLNALGEPMQAPVQWTCEAAKIGPDGRLRAEKPGEYVVVAAAAGIKGSAAVTVGEAFVDGFNHGGALLRGWSTVDLSEGPGRWCPPGRGHSLLNSLWQHNPSCRSMLLWDHGTDWTDCSIQADVFLTPRRGRAFEIGKGRSIAHGLVIRASGKDNHYRLVIRRTDDGGQVRLIKRVGGKDTVLAETDKPPALAPFDWQANRMCPGWHKTSKLHAEERGLHQWRMDRMKLQATGRVLRAWINGREVFAEPVRDADLQAGTAGLYAENRTVLDNVEVRPSR